VNGLPHPFEHRVKELPRLLWVTIGQELQRALQIGEQHGDLLALTFERPLDVRIFSARCLGV